MIVLSLLAAYAFTGLVRWMVAMDTISIAVNANLERMFGRVDELLVIGASILLLLVSLIAWPAINLKEAPSEKR